MDLEEITRKLLDKGLSREEILRRLAEIIREYKGPHLSDRKIEKIAEAILEDVERSRLRPRSEIVKELLEIPRSNVQMWRLGVGSRGEGDFFLHRCLASLLPSLGDLGGRELDDAGAARLERGYIVCSIDGMHSRLSDFPFLAGFHATRAALRDIMIKGARALGILCDVRLADDGDVSKILDFMAGVSAVCEALSIPILGGSTLRIGGDMVYGERLVGTIAAIGYSERRPAPRRGAREGDLILLTEGSGGGTVSTIAIYGGMHDVLLETINLDFVLACDLLLRTGLFWIVRGATDVTNGGLRGDLWEISELSRTRIILDEERALSLINERVLNMLRTLNIDPLGISTGSLMLIGDEETLEECKRILGEAGIRSDFVGRVERGRGVYVERDGELRPLERRFRESPYTSVKKAWGDAHPPDFDEMKKKVVKALEKCIEKRNLVLEILRKRSEERERL